MAKVKFQQVKHEEESSEDEAGKAAEHVQFLKAKLLQVKAERPAATKSKAPAFVKAELPAATKSKAPMPVKAELPDDFLTFAKFGERVVAKREAMAMAKAVQPSADAVMAKAVDEVLENDELQKQWRISAKKESMAKAVDEVAEKAEVPDFVKRWRVENQVDEVVENQPRWRPGTAVQLAEVAAMEAKAVQPSAAVDAVMAQSPWRHGTPLQIAEEAASAAKKRGASEPESRYVGYMKMEELAAREFHVKWQDRGPKAPDDATETWRGQHYRQGSGRWSNRGGADRGAHAEWHRSGASASSKPKGAWQKFFDDEGPRPKVMRDAPKWVLDKLRKWGEDV